MYRLNWPSGLVSSYLIVYFHLKISSILIHILHAIRNLSKVKSSWNLVSNLNILDIIMLNINVSILFMLSQIHINGKS